jgi:hypothetical protein
MLSSLLLAAALTCEPALTEQLLITRYGRANVKRAQIYLAEGAEAPGTVVFPKDESKRIEIVWRGKRQKPEWIRIPAGSTWTFAGIRVGMPLAEVEKLNGRPFTLSGFDWDYGGAVTNWRGGKLAQAGKPCIVQITFDRTVPDNPTKTLEKAIDETSGDRELGSNAANVRAVKPHVGQITISYPR